MNGKAFAILNTIILSELSRVMVAKTQKRFVSLIDGEVQTFLGGEENHSIQKKKKKTESYVFSGFGVGISLG